MFKNNKGFMLAEVVVTSAIVLTGLVSLYATFTKLYNNYNIRKNYYSVDGMYAIKGMIDYSIDTGKLNDIFKEEKFVNDKFYFINNGSCVSNIFNDEYCEELVSLYGIENMVIISYKKDVLNGLKNDNISETFKDYIDFTNNYYDFDDTSKYNYLILVEYNKDGKNLRYSSMGMW